MFISTKSWFEQLLSKSNTERRKLLWRLPITLNVIQMEIDLESVLQDTWENKVKVSFQITSNSICSISTSIREALLSQQPVNNKNEYHQRIKQKKILKITYWIDHTFQSQHCKDHILELMLMMPSCDHNLWRWLCCSKWISFQPI